MALITTKLIQSLSLIMYDLQEMFNASVLMNKEAIQDEAVMNVLTKAAQDNFEFKSICNDRVTIDEWINS